MRPSLVSALAVLGMLLGGCGGGATEGAGDAGAESGFNGGGQPGGHAGTPGGGGATGGASASHGGAASGGQAGGVANAGNAGRADSGGAGHGGGGGSGGSTGSPKDCKRGIGWHGSSLTNAEISSKVTWWYTWGLSVQNVGQGLEFVPMQWGGGSKAETIEKALRADAKYLLGYNEPNFFAQANLSALQAAADWPVLEGVAKARGLKLVSPAVNYCGDDETGTGDCHDTNPVGYLQDFFAACSDCQVDYVAVHWYNCDGASLEWYLDLFAQFNRPIWLTEVACAYGGDTSVAGQEKYMREAVPILEARSDVFRYSWFSGDPLPNARLLSADGALTELGKVYVSLPHDPTCTP